MPPKRITADKFNYFETTGFPLAVRRVTTDSAHNPSHPHDLTEQKHSHDFCELVIVTRGRAMHWLEGGTFPVAAGDVFLLQDTQSHYFFDRQDLELINIMYDAGRIGLPENELRKLPGYCALFMLEPTYRRTHRFESRLHLKRVPLAHAEQIAADMERECTRQEPGCEAALRAKLTELIVFLSRAYSTTETVEGHALLRMGNVIGALENDCTKEWKLEELQKIAGMSRSHFMRVFRKATGQTPIEYLIRLRIQKAFTLLNDPTLTITEIAHETGFNDSNYFTRQFRKATGTSPSAWRKRHSN